jgi:DNA-binding NtrC family response regulator
LREHQKETDRTIEGFHPKALQALQEYSWPYNVRELSQEVWSAVVFGKSHMIMLEDLRPEIAGKSCVTSAATGNLSAGLEAEEKRLILSALERTRGHVTRAALVLNRTPQYLQRRITNLGLRPTLNRIRDGS